jgi:hypothetical protein
VAGHQRADDKVNHALDAECPWPHKEPVELQKRIDELDERPLAHGMSNMEGRSRHSVEWPRGGGE